MGELILNPLNWYALRVRPRSERAIAGSLLRDGIEEFLPLVRSRRLWSDRIKHLDLPLFPGYVFCRLDLTKPGRRLVSLPGVLGFVGFDGGPAVIPEEQLASIRRMLDSDRRITPLGLLRVGKPVRIVDGPLAGLVGTLERIRDRDHFVVSLPLLQRSVAVTLEGECISPYV
jgi:transcription antitermination factor NusG